MAHPRQPRIKLKERVFAVYSKCAIVFLPWSIFWWLVGLAAYYGFRLNKNDHSGDRSIGWVLFAPVTLPLLPYTWLKQKLENRQMAKQER